MKLGKLSIVVSTAALTALNASATIYNTGYSTSLNGSGQLVDNLWTVTSVQNAPAPISGYTTPYQAFSLPSASITWPWDLSAPPVGAPNNALTLWDSNEQPAFSGSDTVGMVTTYTLNFTAAVGSYPIAFEDDNYVSMYLGAVSSANLFYTDVPLNESSFANFQSWNSATVNVTTAGANQLNIVVGNYPFPTQNYTGLRVNFSTNPVPEPSSMALVAGGLALFASLKRRNSK